MILSRVIYFLVCFVFCTKGIAQDVTSRIQEIQIATSSISDRSEIIKYYKSILQITDSLDRNGKGLINQRIYAWGVKAHIEYELGNILQSEASSIRTLELLDSVENSDWRKLAKLKSYNQLGMLKSNLVDFEKAIYYYNKVISLSDDPLYHSIAYSNLGNAYFNLDEFNLALEYYNRSLELTQESKDLKFKARVIGSIGRTQSALNLPEAESSLFRSLELRDKANSDEGKFWSHLHLSEHYQKVGDDRKANQYAQLALEFANESKLVSFEIIALENLLHLEDVETANRYVVLKDSLDRANQINSNKFAEVRYGVAVKEREAQQLRLKNEYNTLIFIIITLVIILITVLLYYRIRQRNRLALIKESIKTENRISKKIHDEIANDLYHTMIKMDKEQLQNIHLIDEMDNIYRRVRDISNDNSPIDAESDFSTTLKDLLLSYKNDFTNITLLNLKTIDWSHLKSADKTNLYRVFQELLTNMKKHSNASQVLFSFDQIGKEINITYKDNGRGTDLKKGNGLENMENRIQAIDGVITFETDKNEGFKATITI